MKIETDHISPEEEEYLLAVLKDGKFPDLEGIWALMDEAWEECQCDSAVMDRRIENFYSHPVWLLNGLFIGQHNESQKNRRMFTDYVASLGPGRVADFGGGFGALARMIGERCPATEVHVVEPHPHALAMALAEKTPNVRYVSELSGKYDVLIATDVFEHVLDPLKLVESTAAHLRSDGKYLIANCFWPVIRCHLPATFHFRYSWDAAMAAMNLKPEISVAYGRAYTRRGPVVSASARRLEQRSMEWFQMIERLPSKIRARVGRLLFPVRK